MEENHISNVFIKYILQRKTNKPPENIFLDCMLYRLGTCNLIFFFQISTYSQYYQHIFQIIINILENK